MSFLTSPAIKQDALESATYTVADISRLLQCSTRHIFRLNDRGEIPGLIRMGSGRLLRFHRGIIDQWLLEMASNPASTGANDQPQTPSN